MKCIFLLSGDYTDLAEEELISLLNIKKHEVIGRLLIADLQYDEKELKKAGKRLALAKIICKFLFECKADELIYFMKKYGWNAVYEDDFRLRINNLNISPITKKSIKNKIGKKQIKKFSEKELAGHIWNSVKNPKVNLENSKTKIEIFIVDGKACCGLLVYENREKFEDRRSHLRPFSHPSSLHPKLARAFVNISGIKEGETLLDPFCGTGGFLIEAGLMNVKTAGYDISKNMIEGCRNNLKHFGIKHFKVTNKNAIDVNDKFDYLVTDLPYGLNSNIYLQYNKKSINKRLNKINLKVNRKNQIIGIENFYLKFLLRLRKILRKKAVIIFPNYVNYELLLKKSKFKIEKEFEIYVHRSLTRKIVRIR